MDSLLIREIETPTGQVVLLNEGDYLGLQNRSISMSSNGYAQIFHDGKVRTLHSVIMGVGDGTGFSILVDHVNRNKLDNRRENLRLVTPYESNLNRRDRTRLHDLPPCVYPNKGGYTARVTRHRKRYNLGTYATPEEALKVVEDFKSEFDLIEREED